MVELADGPAGCDVGHRDPERDPGRDVVVDSSAKVRGEADVADERAVDIGARRLLTVMERLLDEFISRVEPHSDNQEAGA